MRFWNNDVLSHLEGVVETILNTPHPLLRSDLSHKGRGNSFPSIVDKLLDDENQITEDE